MKDLYVDNLITGTNSQDAELQMYEQGQQTLRNSFKKEDRFDGKDMKVLDTIWNMDDNCIYAPVKESYEPEVSKETDFDPLGFFDPSLLNTKLSKIIKTCQSRINMLTDGKKSMRT